MGYTDQLLTGCALQLQADDIGVWNAAGVYSAGQTGIVLAYLPDQPDAAIALTAYPVLDDSTEGSDVVGVQVKSREAGEDPRPAMDLADLVHQSWHMRHDLVLPNGVQVTQIERRSALSDGRDQNRRWGTTQNFYFTVPRQLPHRP